MHNVDCLEMGLCQRNVKVQDVIERNSKSMDLVTFNG